MGTSQIKTQYTKTLADFVSNTNYDNLDQPTCHAAKRLILDTLGNTVGGSGTEASRIAVATRRQLGGVPESTILMTGEKSSCATAIFANVVQASALEFDDTCLNLGHHAQNSLMPALAIAEREGSTGKELLAAFTLAYDIGARIASSSRHVVLDENGEVKVNPSGGGVNWVVFSAVVGAAKLLQLQPEQIVSAMGVAGFSATVPTGGRWVEPPRNHFKYNPYSVMAESGTMAALLAGNGFTGDPAILDGSPETGLADWWLMSGAIGSEPEKAIERLGERWFVNDASVKPYPSCRFTHAPLEMFEQIKRQHQLKADEIDQVRVKTVGQMFVYHMDSPVVENASDCQFSMPHCVAMLALDVTPGPQWVDSKYWHDSDVAKMKEKVICQVYEKADQSVMKELLAGAWIHVPTLVEVDARGETFTAQTDRPPGDPTPEKAMSDEVLIQKFRENCAGVLSEEKIEKAIELLMALEEQDNLDEIVACFS